MRPTPIGRFTDTPSYEELQREIARLRLTDEEREAVAWTIDLGGGNVYDIQNFQWEAEAIAAALLKTEGVIAKAVPLYRHTQPTLTDAEREAVEVAAEAYADDHGERFAATLRALLERLG